MFSGRKSLFFASAFSGKLENRIGNPIQRIRNGETSHRRRHFGQSSGIEKQAADLLQKADDDIQLGQAIMALGITDPSVVMGCMQAVKTVAATDPVEAMFTALAETVSAYVSNSDVQSGIKQYGKGIEMMEDAQVVGPALGKAAEAVGKQFKVDQIGRASCRERV